MHGNGRGERRMRNCMILLCVRTMARDAQCRSFLSFMQHEKEEEEKYDEEIKRTEEREVRRRRDEEAVEKFLPSTQQFSTVIENTLPCMKLFFPNSLI